MTSSELPDKLRAMRGKIKFSVCNKTGWITGLDEDTLRTLCYVYNCREEIAKKLENG